MLPSVPTGTVELRSIIEPVRSVTRRCPGQVIYLEAEATNINPKTNELTLKQSTTVVSGHSGKDTSLLNRLLPNTLGLKKSLPP